MNKNHELIIGNLSQEFNLRSGTSTKEKFVDALTAAIEELLSSDFPKLINILYRLDIDEQKLKNELKNNPAVNPGPLIAKLIIERQLQKLDSRKNYPRDTSVPEEEEW